MRGFLSAAVLALLAALFAGCVGTDTGADDDATGPLFAADWSLKALPFGEGHNHEAADDHQNLSTPNFRIVGHEPLLSPYYDGHTPAGYLCGDAQPVADGRILAVVESRSDVGFAIADVTVPDAPEWLGELVMESTYVYDLAVVPDGKHVILVTSDASPPDLPVPTSALALDVDGRLVHTGMQWRTPCDPTPRPLAWAVTEDPVPRPISLLLVDIQDPANPTIIDQRPLTGFGHSAFSTILNGRTWIVASNVGHASTQTFQFYELIDTPLGARLGYLSTFNTQPHTDVGPTAIGGHTEAWIHKHPVTGMTLGYVMGGRDFVTLDLTDPMRPQPLGYWTDTVPGRESPVANLHSVYPMTTLMNGRHYTAIGPEFHDRPESQPSGTVWILDTTDPTNIHEVAAWTLPHDPEWTGVYMFSNHYLGIHDTTLFVSMYHGGVWALDLSNLAAANGNLVQLESIGVFIPAEKSPAPPENVVRWSPTLEEVIPLPDGTLVTFDSMSGLYTFRFDALNPAPPPQPWPVPPL